MIRLILPALAFCIIAGCARQESKESIPLAPGTSRNLPQNPGTTAFWIDRIGPTTNPTGKEPISIDEISDFTTSGWAVDKQNASVAGGVEIVIDSKPYQMPYGFDREDLIVPLKSAAYAHAGFRAAFPARALGEGSHTISYRILTSDRKSYYFTPEFTLIVR